MLTEPRLAFRMIGLVVLTAATFICLTYPYVGTSVVVSEFLAASLFVTVSIGLALGTTRISAALAEVLQRIFGEAPAPRSRATGGRFKSLADALTRSAKITRGRAVALLHLFDGKIRRESGAETARLCVAVVKSASYPVISKTLDGTITGWNPAAERLYQYTAAEAIGRNISMIVPPERVEENSIVFAKALKEGRVDNFETVRVAKSGRKINVSLSLFMVEPPVGDTAGADITRDLSEDTFNLKKLQTAFDSCSSGMIVVEDDGRIAMVNAEAERMFGYQRTRLIGEPIEKLIPSRLDDRALEISSFAAPVGTGRHAEKNPGVVGLRHDGTEFPIEVNLQSIRHAENSVRLLVIADVTDRRRLDRLKDEFVSTVSHELRTPMTSIFASLSLLAGGAAGKMPDSAARLLAISHANCERLVRLLSDILDIQKLESGQSIFKVEQVRVLPLIEKTIESLRGFARQHGISLRLDVTSPDCRVDADPDRLIQVLTNLVSNAIKFSRVDTEVAIGVERRNDTVVILVRDHGPGIPEGFKERVFEKFAQADATNSREKSGTGLGLSIVRQIVERLHGQVGFRDAAGGGTIFYVVLPSSRPKTAAGHEIASILHDGTTVARPRERGSM